MVLFGNFMLSACVDDNVSPEPPEPPASVVDPNLPEEIRNGYSISFNIDLNQFGGDRYTRTDNADLMEVDNYVDLEKLRILFFVCASDQSVPGQNKSVADTTRVKGRKNQELPYFTGENDHFLFESKSRWVSQLMDDESTSAKWQVTTPVFTYGNNDDYRWEDIRYALENYPFKIVVLANRPDLVDFGDFDNKFGKSVPFYTGRGPYWGPSDTWIPYERRHLGDNTDQIDVGVNFDDKPTINDLHHCQWDVVYASKNSGDKDTFKGEGIYSFIMKNPKPKDFVSVNGKNYVPQPGDKVDFDVNQTNMMGALSNWTTKIGDITWYYLPDKVNQAIPMYGVQVFDPIQHWAPGSPYNVSDGHLSASGAYFRKNINLLRSLVKVELKIPKRMKVKGVEQDIEIKEPTLCYSNVMARCEPLDVATPPERLWNEENWTLDRYCEWKDIYDYGPIINQSNPAVTTPVDYMHQRMAWFYGAWKDWWHFNSQDHDYGLSPASNYFNNYDREYPRIYNPVIQRNANGRIDNCEVSREEDDYYYYVIYTGERNINDPSKFGTDEAFKAINSEFMYFQFTILNNTYYIPLADYNKNDLAKNYYTSSTLIKNYKEPMATGEQKNWNWPLLRNHVYTFTIRNIGDLTETGDFFNVEAVSSEQRTAPTFWFN